MVYLLLLRTSGILRLATVSTHGEHAQSTGIVFSLPLSRFKLKEQRVVGLTQVRLGRDSTTEVVLCF